MSRVRGKGVSMIFQDPMTSLDPVYRVGRQIEETLRVHDKRLSRKAADARAIELLELVGIPNAAGRIGSYPHEFSGGMRQRVVIAIAIANQPDVIIADEPTTALDVTVQAQILEVLDTALEETGAAMVLITHDLGVVAGVADRVLVMYAGRPVEIGSVEDIYYEPRMPYTLGLLGSLPRLDSSGRERLTPIIGSPPSLVNMPPGCPFAPRCPLHIAECDAGEPPLFDVGRGHLAACIRTEIVERAHGDATEVFEETSTDTLLADEAYPLLDEDVAAADRDTGPSTEAQGEIAPDHAPGETGSIVSPKGTAS
jgi:peptide/nickel transport system ATP-binding protein